MIGAVVDKARARSYILLVDVWFIDMTGGSFEAVC